MSLVALPGAGQTGGPGGSTKAADRVGFKVLHTIRQPMLEVAAAAPATGTSATRVARVITPGPELMVAIGLTFEPTTPVVIASYASAAWTATAMRSGSSEGREGRYHTIFSAAALPQQYLIAGIADDIEISADLTIPLDGGAAGIRGQWVLEVKWGAALNLCPEDREFLFGQCVVKAPAARVGLLIP